jgi:hypothetical protein
LTGTKKREITKYKARGGRVKRNKRDIFILLLKKVFLLKKERKTLSLIENKTDKSGNLDK